MLSPKSTARHFRIFAAALLATVLFAGSAQAGVGLTAQPAKLPEWALAVLSLRQVGLVFDKAGAYANKILPNSAELAKQKLMSYFNFPISRGLKKDDAALIYFLDPIATKLQDETAMVLPLADAAMMKLALVNTLGVPAEAAGLLTFTIPQQLPNPDKQLVVKLAGDKMLVAPSAEVMKQLEDFAGKSTPYELMGQTGDDAVLTVKMAQVRRLYGIILDGCLELGVLSATKDAPELAQTLKTRAAAIVNTLWQIDLLELHVTLDDTGASASLELKIRPVKDSALAVSLQKFVNVNTGKLIRDMPLDAPLVAVWNMNGASVAQGIRAELAAQTAADANASPLAKAGRELSQSVADMLDPIRGEGGLALSVKERGIAALFAGESADPAKVVAAVKAGLEIAAALADQQIRAQTGTPNLPPLVRLKSGTAQTAYKGATISEFRLEMPLAGEKEKAEIGRMLCWPPTLHAASVGKTALFTLGKNSAEAINLAVDRDKEGKQALPSIFTAGSAAVVLARPVGLVRGLLELNPELNTDVDRLTAGLGDAAALLSVRLGDGMAGLRLDLPATVPAAVWQLVERMENAHVGLELPLTAEPEGTVPAPPAAK